MKDGSDTKICSTCNLLCRKIGCKKALADGDATLCSDCQLKRDVAKRIIIPNEALITDLNENNVLGGRGKRINSQAGNMQFRDLVHSKKSEYSAQNTNKGRNLIAAGIHSNIRIMDPAGQFLKKHNDTRMWFDIGDA